MIPQKMLVPHCIWVLLFSSLITLSWTWLYFMSGVLCFFGSLIGVMGLIISVNYSYQKGMEDKSMEIADETVKTFLRNAQSRSPATKKTPSISHLRKKWDPFIDTHLHLVVKKP